MHGEDGEREGGRNLICCALEWTRVAASLTIPFFFFLMCMGEGGAWEGDSLI